MTIINIIDKEQDINNIMTKEELTKEELTKEELTKEELTKEELTKEELTKEEQITKTAKDTSMLQNIHIAQLEMKLSEVQQSERSNFLRFRAEIENIRRRSEQSIEKAHKFALEHFISELLPVIDNLERALTMSDKLNNKLSGIMEGIELTLKSLLDTMNKFGLEIINKTDIPFNPNIHQAMTILESDKHEPNQVMMIMQKGYTLNGRLLRPAMVSVSKIKN